MEDVRAAVASGRLAEPVVVVLEGEARRGVDVGIADGVTVIHAPGSGDETLVAVTGESGGRVVLVSSDRRLLERARALGALTASARWLTDTVLS